MSECVFYEGFTRFSDLERTQGKQYAIDLYKSRHHGEYNPHAIASLGQATVVDPVSDNSPADPYALDNCP